MAQQKSSKTIDAFPVPSSRMVLWYYRGDVSQDPRIAIITSFGRRAGLELTIFESGMASVQCASGVRHQDDPYHREHPQHALSCGVWNYLPSQDQRTVEQAKEEVDSKEANRVNRTKTA